MTAFTAAIACLGRVWAIFGNMSSAVALVARNVTGATIIRRFGAITRPMANFVAFVTRWIVRLCAILRNMTDAIATIATLRFLRASTSKMTILVAFKTFLSIIAASHITTTATTTEVAVAGKVTRAITLVARGSHGHYEQIYRYLTN